MTELRRVYTSAADSTSIDAFGRWRTSEPYTLFDSKQLHDSLPFVWDDAETSGSGTSTAHYPNEASTKIGVSGTTAGVRVRQTFQRFNYQPGKSQLIFLTFSEFDTSTGISKRVGYYDDENGLFFESSEGTVSVVRRTYVSGSAVDNSVGQSSWNLDKLDGTGESGVTLDFTKAQIAAIDFEWLGVGRVRFGFVVDGMIIYCHEMNNANTLTTVYMSTPNLPVRYEIENDGTGASDVFVHLCSSVQSEGGQDDTGILRHKKTGAISGLTSGNTYAAIGIRLKSARLDSVIKMIKGAFICTTNNDQAAWSAYFNPTVAGTFTYSDESNSSVQTAIGTSSNTITGGTEIDGGYFVTSLQGTENLVNALKLGASIAGTPDEIVIAITPITASITAHAALTWRELS